MKNFFLRNDTWMRYAPAMITEQEQAVLDNTAPENEDARNQLINDIYQRSVVVAGAADRAVLNDIYQEHKPENATLISAHISLPEQVGVLNWRVNGEHVQVRL